MPTVTIGVPVFNGAEQIAECLDCLLQQTFEDIEIVVSDNASTDTTGDIVRAYSARDSRVRYIRQPENIGLLANFRAVFEAAQSSYFVFRCHDDLSSLNYVEVLLGALRGNPRAGLAVPTVKSYRVGRPVRTHRMPKSHTFQILNISELLFNSHAAWFCGLWEKAALRPVFERNWAIYHSPWGPDHLTIYPFLIDRRVATAPEAIFIQRVTPKQAAAAYSRPDLQQMISLRHTFMATCKFYRRELGISGVQEFLLAALTWLYTGKRIYPARRILLRMIMRRN